MFWTLFYDSNEFGARDLISMSLKTQGRSSALHDTITFGSHKGLSSQHFAFSQTTTMSRSMNAFAAGGSSSESESEQDDFLHLSTDPNADEFADYNPRKRRRTGRDAKESAALGIFGSESEDEGPGKRWTSKSLRGKGMSFVQSGQKQRDIDKDEEVYDDEYNEEVTEDKHGAYPEDDEDVDMGDTSEKQTSGLRAGFGAQTASRLGLGSGGGGGLGWQSPAARTMGLGSGSSTASPLGLGFMPSSAAIPVLNKNLEDGIPVKRVAMPSAFSIPATTKTGKFATSTTINTGSFAARMMAKMGYKEGQGLGKEGQGRSGVIEVQLRPQGVGLGAVKEKSKQEREEERRQAARRGETLDDSEEEKKKKSLKVKISGADSGISTPRRRPKPKFQSLPELQRAAPGLKIPDAFTPILDMTGPGQKYLTSTSGLATPTTGVTESTALVEARKLARRAQNDLSYFIEEWKGLEERKAWVELEILQQQQAMDEQRSSSEQLGSAAEIVQGLSEAVRDGQWDPVIEALTKLESLGVAGNGELASVAVAAVHPFFRQAIEGWQPLEDPKLSGVASDGFVSALLSIRELLGMTPESTSSSLTVQNLCLNNSHATRAHKTTPYESLIFIVWLPKVRSAITNSWDVHDPSPLLSLLDLWTPLIPTFVWTQILEHLILRKLDEAIANWNPKKRLRTSSLPHLWLFPWLQYLPAHHLDSRASSGLVADVKRKFRVLIDSWDFRRGVIPGLTQWRDLLRPSSSSKDDSWTPLLLNHVLPNLAKYLRTNFQVAPQDQEPYMKTLQNVFEWRGVLGDRIMGQLLVDELFPMWQDVLHQWLTLDGVNYLEIRDWFDFWRSTIPEEISNVPIVKSEWRKGDELINKALDLGERAKTDLPAPAKPSREARPAAPPVVPEPENKLEKQEQEEVSFRHQLEDWCMTRDLQFIPEKSRLEAGGPVYRITAAAIGKGGVLIYLRGESIYVQIKRGTWTPLGKEMDALFELAHR